MSFSDRVQSLNDALFPTNPSKETADRLGVFGGQSFGFAHGVDTLFANNFYQDKAVGDQFAVAVGMTTPIPRSIFNKFALFNFRGLYGGLTGGKPFESFRDDGYNDEGYNARNVSIGKIIEYYGDNYARIAYSASDFLYCKYYKKIPELTTLSGFTIVKHKASTYHTYYYPTHTRYILESRTTAWVRLKRT